MALTDSRNKSALIPTLTVFLYIYSRLLEEGNVDGAEEQKQRIEQLQRERRKVLQDNNMTHQPRFFKYALFLVCKVFVCSVCVCLFVLFFCLFGWLFGCLFFFPT